MTTDAAVAPGAELAVTSRLVVLADGPRIILVGEGSAVLVARDGTVVAEATGTMGDTVPVTLTAGATYVAGTVPSRVALFGCDGTELAPGRYELVAVVGYGGDPLNAGVDGGPGTHRLVSPPVEVTITGPVPDRTATAG